jgi:hypothetical protein
VFYDGAKSPNCVVEIFCTTGGQTLLSCRAQWKKTFISTSNIIISQSVRSNVMKLFAHVLLVVYCKILRLKVQKSEKNSFELLELEMADLERFWRKSPLGPLGVNSNKSSLSFQSN